MLIQLDRECLDVYKRKVDQASNSRELLLNTLANSKENLAILLSSLGENTLYSTVSTPLCLMISMINGWHEM